LCTCTTLECRTTIVDARSRGYGSYSLREKSHIYHSITRAECICFYPVSYWPIRPADYRKKKQECK
jgi:hypothetical protein